MFDGNEWPRHEPGLVENHKAERMTIGKFHITDHVNYFTDRALGSYVLEPWRNEFKA